MYPVGTEILVVDSNAKRRQFSEGLLAGEGFAVTAVADGFSAIRAAAGHRFALVVSELQLPGTFDGTMVLRQIRTRQPWLKALYTDAARLRPRLLDGEHDEFIACPYDGRELLGCVFELLQRERLAYPCRHRAG